MQMENREFKGSCFGVKLVRRGEKDPHVCIQLLGEDDEYWFNIGNGFSSHWFDFKFRYNEGPNLVAAQQGRAAATSISSWVTHDCGPNNEMFSFHPGGAFAVFADGSAHFLIETMDLKTFYALGTRASSDTVESF